MALLLAAIAAPLFAAIPAAAARRRGAIVASLSLLVSAAALLASLGRGLEEEYALEPSLGLVTFDGDDYNVTFSLVTCLVSALTLPSVPHWLKRARRRPAPGLVYALYLTAAAALVATTLSGTLTTFFAFLETYLVASWLLLLLWNGGGRHAALVYLVFTEVGALVTLLGIAVIYDSYGVLGFRQLAPLLSRAASEQLAPIFALLAAGPLVKMAVVPLHAWLPAVYSSAPIPLLVLMTLAEGAGGWALAKLAVLTMPNALEAAWLRQALLALAALTAVYGGLAALAQRDARGLLAYSSVSQSGYLLLGVACGRNVAAASALLLFTAHSLAKTSLLTIFGYLEELSETSSLEAFGGLASSMPLSAVSALLSFLSLAGVPPTLGFWAELEVFAGVVRLLIGGGAIGLAGAAALSASTILSAAYGILSFRKVFMGPVRAQLREKVGTAVVSSLAASLALVALGLYPSPLLSGLPKIP